MNAKYQKGMSTLGLLIVAMLVVAAMLLAIKVVPVYVDDYAISKAMTALSEEEKLYNKSKSEIRSMLRRKLAADYTSGLSDEAIQIRKNRDTITVDVVYEARVPVVYNLDLVAKFDHHIEQRQ